MRSRSASRARHALEAIYVEHRVSDWGFDHVRRHERRHAVFLAAIHAASRLSPSFGSHRGRTTRSDSAIVDLIRPAVFGSSGAVPSGTDRAPRLRRAEWRSPVQPYPRGEAPIQLALRRSPLEPDARTTRFPSRDRRHSHSATYSSASAADGTYPPARAVNCARHRQAGRRRALVQNRRAERLHRLLEGRDNLGLRQEAHVFLDRLVCPR